MTAMAWEHLREPDLRGRTVVMTGASDGLGREAALQLARWGADLVLGVRSRAKGEIVRERIVRETGRCRRLALPWTCSSCIRVGC